MLSIIFISVFIILMIFIGVWGMRKTKNLNDFFLGGRKIGPVVSALAFGTSYFSAVLFIGFAGKLGWAFGLKSMWIALGNALLGSLLAWLVLGHRTRVMTHNLNAMTMPEFFEARYKAPGLKIVSALIIFIFLLPYSASVFKGLGHLFQVNFNISYSSALLIMTLITGIYLVLGGYFAVTLTDFIQGLIMLVGSIIMVCVLTGKAGGFTQVIQEITTRYNAHIPPAKQPGWLILSSLVFMTSFGTWGLPQMIQKFYAIKSEKVIKTAALITTVFALIVVCAAYFTGSMSHIFFDSLPMQNGKPAFDLLVPELLKTNLPEALMALILLLVLSASMSTLASIVLISSSTIAIDIYQKHRVSDKHHDRTLLLMRILSGIFVAISLIIALYPFDIILVLMSLSWGAVAGPFMASYLYGLYWKKTSKAGVWAGMLTGLFLAIGLFFVLGPAKSPISASIAMIVPFFVIPAVSFFTSKPDTETIARAFERI